MAAEAAKKPKVPVIWVTEPNPASQPIFPWNSGSRVQEVVPSQVGYTGVSWEKTQGIFSFRAFSPSGRA